MKYKFFLFKADTYHGGETVEAYFLVFARHTSMALSKLESSKVFSRTFDSNAGSPDIDQLDLQEYSDYGKRVVKLVEYADN